MPAAATFARNTVRSAGDTGGVDLHGAALSQRRTAGRQRERGPIGRAVAQVDGGPTDPPMPFHAAPSTPSADNCVSLRRPFW